MIIITFSVLKQTFVVAMPAPVEGETNPLSRKLEKVLSLNISQSENPDLVLALKVILRRGKTLLIHLAH